MTCALALLVLGFTLGARAQTVNMDILYPLAEVEFREDGSYGLLSVGVDQGVVEGGLRPHYQMRENGSFAHRGNVELLSVADSSCVVRLAWAEGDTLRYSDAVDLRFRLEPPPERQVLWELIEYGILLTDDEGEVFYDFRLTMGSTSARLDSILYDYSTRSVLKALPTYDAMEKAHEPVEGGRYAGQSVYETMSATTPAMVEDFYQNLLSFPGNHMGQVLDFPLLYANWLLNEAKASPEEAMSVGLAEGPERFREQLPEFLESIADPHSEESWPRNWNSRARDLWSEERHQECMEQLAIFRIACEVVDVPRWWDLYWVARADILDWNGEEEASIEAYHQSILAAEGDSSSLSVSHNNLAGAYKDLERFEEACRHYRLAIELNGAWEDPDTDPGSAISWSHLARSRKGLGDYAGAIEAFEIAARLYGLQGSLLALEQRYHALSILGDIHSEHGRNREAIDAWQRGLDTARTLGWDATVADALDDMSDGHWSLGELERAVELRLEAVRLHGEEGYFRDQAYTQTNLAILYSVLGETELAADYFRLAIESHRGREEWWDLGDVHYRLGNMQREQGLFDEAWEQLEEAARLLAEHGDAEDMAQVQRERAEIFEGRGDGHAADSLYAMALAGYREAESTVEEARTQQWWGNSLNRRKELDGALAKLEASLELWEAADDLGGLSDTHRSLASLYGNMRGDRLRARRFVEQALETARRMPDIDREAQALLIRVDILFADGEMDEAEADQQRAIELYRSSGNEQGTIDALTGLGSLLARRGEFELAMAQFDETLSRAEASAYESSVAFALDRRSWFAHLIGRNEQAKIDAERCIGIYHELGNELMESNAINTLASIEKAQGNFDASLAHYAKFHAIAKAWKDNSSLAAFFNNAGDAYFALGEYERAGEHFRQGITHGELAHYFTAIAASSANLAKVHLKLGQADEALAMTLRSIEAAEQTKLEPRIIDAHYFRGRILRELGRGPEAREILLPLLDRAKALGMRVTVATIQTELGILAWQEENHAAARASLNDAIELAHEMGNPNLVWRALLYLARSLRDGGDQEAALGRFQEALTSLEAVRGSLADAKQGASFQSKHGDIYRELVDLLLELGREEEAWSVIGLMKSEELRELDKRSRKAGLDEPEQALMAEAEQLLSREARLGKQLADEQAKPEAERRQDFIGELKDEIKSIQKRFRQFIRGLAAEHGELVERLEIQPSNLKALQKKLDDGEAFLEPLLLPDRLVLFLVRAGKSPLIYREFLVSEARVDSLIREMRESLSRPGEVWGSERAARLAGRRPAGQLLDPAKPARELHDLLLAPLAGDLHGVEHLIVSPSGRLRYIPFAALFDGERYLLERYTLSTLTQAGAMGGQEPVSEASPLLAFGNPDGSLPGAEQEVQNLAKLWNPTPVTTVFGEAATMDRLEDELEEFRILHLATHGVLRSDRPEDSYILLAGEDEGAQLKLLDIVTLPLYEIELAVLSACQTALGTDGTGREITSLAHTFEQTGASSVIASLWSVGDKSTSLLMLDFYDGLREPATSRSSALREAQLRMLREGDFKHPYYWAPFILIGNWH